MKINKQARREAKELFRSCVLNGVLDEARVRLIVRQVIQLKPRAYLAILLHFQRLVKLEVARRTARIETATALDPALQQQVTASLARTYGPGLHLSFGTNPALLGGMRAQIGSDVYDGSVRGRLDQLEQSF